VVPLNIGPRERQFGGENRRCRAHVVTTSRGGPVFRFRGIPNNLHVPVSFWSWVMPRAGCADVRRRSPSATKPVRTPAYAARRSAVVCPDGDHGRDGTGDLPCPRGHPGGVLVRAPSRAEGRMPHRRGMRHGARRREAQVAVLPWRNPARQGTLERRSRERARRIRGRAGDNPGATPGRPDGCAVVWNSGAHNARKRGRSALNSFGFSANRGAFDVTHARTAPPFELRSHGIR
jgi:hypothetical protein